jgi:hypothetical protein
VVDRVTATLCAALMLCFQVLTHFEPEFFLLHLYQSGIYLIIILLAFYMHDRWVYMLGMLVPAVWLLLAWAVGLLGGGAREISRIVFAQNPGSVPALLAGITALLAVALIVNCALRWKRQISGQGLWYKTLWPSLIVTLIFYGVLIYWYWSGIPTEPIPVG